MQGPEPPMRHDEASPINQVATTVDQAKRAVYPVVSSVNNWITGVGHALKDDAKRVKRALCREITRPKTRLDPNNKELRNGIQELYFGIAVMMLAVCMGQMLGAVLGGLLNYGPTTLVGLAVSCAEVVAIIGLTLYAYLHLRDNRANVDPHLYRSWLFGLCFSLSFLLGHILGQRMLSTVPAVFFIPPLLTTLLIDSTLPVDFYSDRSKLMCAVTAAGFIATAVMLFCARLFSYQWLVLSILHYIVIFAHYEIVAGNIHSPRFGVVESQLLYVVVLLVLQTLVSLVFGRASF